MDKLILKAIEAIKDSKTDYAIGLLEGVLEMTGASETKAGVIPGLLIPVTPTTNHADDDPISHLDSVAAARLAEVQEMSGVNS